MTYDNAAKIATLNDQLRLTFLGGRVLQSNHVAALDAITQGEIYQAVRYFDDFEAGDDPYREHDFGKVTVQEEAYFWKIDYYDPMMQYASDDPTDPTVTHRVLTIMHASEY